MISYAQNAEDVVLWRCLGRGRPGVFVDLGAGHPVEDSVTKVFSDAGWWGINVEPQPDLFAALMAQRPGEMNINAVVGDRCGLTSLNVAGDGWGLASVNDEVVRRHEGQGVRFRSHVVASVTMQEVLDAAGWPHVDLLKIDVEGAEGVVVASIDFARFRPRVIVIESTEPVLVAVDRPLLARRDDAAFHATLEAAGYVEALFDGINTFYAQHDDVEARTLLGVPANVVDDYVPWRFLTEAQRAALAGSPPVPAARPPAVAAAPAAVAPLLADPRALVLLHSPAHSDARTEDVLSWYAAACGSGDDVTLVSWLPDGVDPRSGSPVEALAGRLQETAGGDPPDVLVVTDAPTDATLERLFAQVHALVAPDAALRSRWDGPVVDDLDPSAVARLLDPPPPDGGVSADGQEESGR